MMRKVLEFAYFTALTRGLFHRLHYCSKFVTIFNKVLHAKPNSEEPMHNAPLPIISCKISKVEFHKALQRAMQETGFLILTNHGLESELEGIAAGMSEFFNLPLNHKESLAPAGFNPKSKHFYRGYFPADLSADTFKEGFDVGPKERRRPEESEFSEARLWFAEETLPQLESQLASYYEKTQSLALRVFEGLTEGIDMRDQVSFDQSVSTLRMLHYPHGSKVDFATPDHTDSGLLTLLWQDQVGGLEVEHPEKGWVEVPPMEGALIVNSGQLLERVSNSFYKPTIHRVRSQKNVSRYSLPFFFEPNISCTFASYKSLPVENYERYLLRQIEPFTEYSALRKRIEVRLG